MLILKTRTFAVCWLLLLLAVADIAHAAVELTPPPGWSTPPSAEAEARAENWAEQLGGKVRASYSTRTDDAFSETLAVVAVPGGLADDAMDKPTAVLESAFGPLIGDGLEVTAAEARGAGFVVAGAWQTGPLHYQGAVISTGPSRELVLLALDAAEVSLYADAFDDALASTTGATAPVHAFDDDRWRLGLVLGWLLAGFAAWFVVPRIVPDAGGHESGGRAVAVACTLLAGIAAIAVYFGLQGSGTALRLAETSPIGLALETALGGVAVAIIAWSVGRWREGRIRRVESAPGGGTFAGRVGGAARAMPRRASAVIPGHHDGPSNLEATAAAPASVPAKADPVPVPTPATRTPIETLVGLPSVAEVEQDDPEFAALMAKSEAMRVAATAQLAEPRPPEQHDVTQVGQAPTPPRPPRPAREQTAVGLFPAPMRDDDPNAR